MLQSVLQSEPLPKILATQPSLHWVPVALSVGVKRLGRETDHLFLVRSYATTPPFLFMA